VLNNTHFDTTRANVEHTGAEARDLVIAEGRQPRSLHPFKGNMDLDALRQPSSNSARRHPRRPGDHDEQLRRRPAGEPRQHPRRAAKSRRHGVPLFLDACRFAENAWFIKTREPGCDRKSAHRDRPRHVQLADGCTMSAKKDGMANIGGFLAIERRRAGRGAAATS
jgi:tryptophanase